MLPFCQWEPPSLLVYRYNCASVFPTENTTGKSRLLPVKNKGGNVVSSPVFPMPVGKVSLTFCQLLPPFCVWARTMLSVFFVLPVSQQVRLSTACIAICELALTGKFALN